MDTQVIIVGAGPAGLLLSRELVTVGIDVVVLERLSSPTGQSRGLGFTCITKDIFDQRGILEDFGDIEVSDLGHFGGIPVDFTVLPGSRQAGKTIPQYQTEAVLEKRAIESGVDLRRGYEAIALSQDDQQVQVRVRNPEGVEENYTAQYLVGCDGGRSNVRKLAGFTFAGVPATREMFLGDVIPTSTIRTRMIGEVTDGGMVMSAPLPNGTTRIVVCERVAPPQRRTEPPTMSEVAAGWERITGEDISGSDPVWLSAFGDAAFQVTEYRRGRVLLAGDSAHIHLPAGGQGMNTSLQDAFNLGWKLAAVLHGHAADTLLDTYHDERHPVGERLLENTRSQGVLFLRGDEAEALRAFLRPLVGKLDVAQFLAAKVSGLDIVYPVGGGTHELLGRRVPDVELSTGDGRTTTLHTLRTNRPVLLDLTDSPALRSRAEAWSDRIDVVVGQEEGSSRLSGTDSLLVRPDGYIAWTAPGSAQQLETALATWFGPAAVSAPA